MGTAALSSTIELATPANGEEIHDFLYPHGFIHPDLDRDAFAACWRHQFFGSGQACVLVARNREGRLVGHYGLMPVPYVVDGKPMRAGYFCQLFVEPAYRRTPLFIQMERRLLREYRGFGFDFLHALIIIEPVLKQHLALGFSRGPAYHTYLFPLRLGSGCKAAWPKAPAFAASAFDGVCGGIGRAALALRRPAWRGVEIAEVSASDLDAGLLNRIVAGRRMYADHSPQAIARRTASFGGKRYRIFAARGGGLDRGYLILRHTRVQRFDVAAIIDVIAPPDDDATWNGLLAHACRAGLEAGRYAVVAAAPAGTPTVRHLNDNLFLRTPSHSWLVYAVPPDLAPGMPPLDDWWSGWYDHDYI